MNTNWLTRTLSVALIIMLALVFLPVTPARAVSPYTSVTSGNWDDNATWGTLAGDIPAAGDTVTIASGHTVTLTAPTTISTLTINGGGILTTSGNALTVNTTLTNAGTITAGASTITINGSFTNNNIFNSNTSTVVYGSSGAQNIAEGSAPPTFNNLTISGGSGTKTLASNVTIQNALSIDTGANLAVPGSFAITANGTTSLTGTLTFSNASPTTNTFTGLVTVNSGGVWNNTTSNSNIVFKGGLTNNGTLTAGTGTYTFQNNNQAIGGTSAISIPNLTVTGAAVTLTNNGTLAIDTALSGTGILAQGGSGSTLSIGGTSGITGLTASVSGNTVNYTGAAQTIKATAYHHLGLSGSGIKTLTGLATINGNLTLSNVITATTAANLAIGGNLSVGVGSTFTVAGFDIAVTGTTSVFGTLTHSVLGGAKTYTGNVIVNSGGIWNDNAAVIPVTFGGNLTNSGTLNAGTGTHTFTGTSKTINGTLSIPNVTVDGTYTNSGTFTVTTALAGAGTLTQGSASVLDIQSTSVTLATLDANTNSNTVKYTRAAIQTVKPIAYKNLSLGGTLAKDTTGVTVNGILSMEGTATVSGATPTYGGSAAIQYNKGANAGTVGLEWPATFTDTGGVTIGGTGLITLNAAKVVSSLTTNSGSVLFNNGFALTVNGNFTNSGTFVTTVATITVNGNFTNSGTLTATGTTTNISTFNLSGDFTSGTITAGATFHLTLAGTATQSIAGFTTTGTVSMTKTGGTATFTGNVNGGALTINGSGGTLNLGTGLTHTFTGVWTQSAGTLNAGSSTLNLAATPSFTSGTFTASTGTVVYNGGVQTVAGLTYNNLTTLNGVKTTGGNVTVNGNLTVTNNTFTVAAFDITVTGSTSVTGILAHSSAIGTKTYNGNVTINLGGTWQDNAAVVPITFGGDLINNGTFTAGTGIHTFTGAAKALGASTKTITIPNVTITGSYTNFGILTVSTDLAGAGSLTQDAAGTLNIGGTSGITTLDASAVGNTVNYTGAAQTIKSITYYHLGLSGTLTKTMATGLTTVNGTLTLSGSVSTTTADNLTIGGNLVIGGGTTFTVDQYAIIVNGTTTVGGTLSYISTTGVKRFIGLVTVTGAWTNSINASINLRGGLTVNSAAFTSGSGNYTFDTTTAQTLDGTNSFAIQNLIVGSGVTLTSDVGTGLVNNAIVFTVNSTLTNVGGSGTFKQGAFSILSFGGSSIGATLDASTNTNTVDYSAAGAQTVKPITYSSLTLSGSGAKDLTGITTINGTLTINGAATTATTTANLTIGGNLAINSGTLTVGSTFDLTVTGITTDSSATASTGLVFSSVSGTKTFNGLVTVTGIWNNAINSDVHFHGGLTANTATFTAGSGNYIFETSSQSIITTIATTIPNIVVTGAAVNLTHTGAATLTISTSLSGTGTFTQGVNALLGLGMADATTGVSVAAFDVTTNLNTVDYNAAGAQVVKPVTYRNLTLSGSGAKDLTGVTTINGNLTLNGTATGTTAANLSITGNLAINAGTLTVGAFDITVTGTTTVTGSLTFNSDNTNTKTFTGLVTVNGTWTNTNSDIHFKNGLTTGGVSSFTSGAGNNIFETNAQAIVAAKKTLLTNVVVTGVTLTNNSTVAAVAITSTLSGTGTFTQGVNSFLSLEMADATTGVSVTTFNVTTNLNTVDYSAAGAQTVKPITYRNLTLSTSGAKTLTGVTTVNGNLIFNGAATATLPNGLTITGGLTINNTAVATLGGNVTVSGNVSIAGGTLSLSANTLSVSGNWTKTAGTFTAGAGTVTLNGSTAQTVTSGGTGATFDFNNLTVNNTGGVTLTNNLAVNGTLTLTQGIVTTNALTLIVGNTGTVSGGNTVSYVLGNLQKTYTTLGLAPSFKFAVGGAKLTGTAAVSSGGPIVTGTGTAFTTQLAAGNKVIISSVEYTVLSITDNTHLTLTTNYAGTTAGGLSIYASGYRPLTLSNLNVAIASYITATISASTEHAQIASSGIDQTLDINRYWTLTTGTANAFTAYDATFAFESDQYDAGADPLAFVVERYQNSAPIAWTIPTIGTVTANSIQATGFTSIGTSSPSSSDFVVGEYPNHTSVSNVSAVSDTYGNTVTLSATLMTGATPFSGQTITFNFNDNPVGPITSATTDGSGVATLSGITLKENVGTYPGGVTATFAGDATHGRSTGTADLTVTQRPITVTAATETRVYDQSTNSAGVPTITSGNLVSPDFVTWTQSFDSKNAGSRTLTPSGTVSDGNFGLNYDVNFVNASGTITPKILTLTGITGANSKIYNGITATTITGTPALPIGGVISGDDATLGTSGGAFDTKHVGTNKTVTVTFVLNGIDAGNYTNDPALTFNADITSASIELTAVSVDKVYDGTASSSTPPGVTSGTLMIGDTALQTYSSKHVGARTLTPSINDGNNGNNYTLTPITASGNITTRPITVTATTDTKTYDGTPSSSGVPTITSGSLAAGDTVTWTQSFDSQDVGARTLTSNGAVSDGNSGGNYNITKVTAAGTINKKTLTITAQNNTLTSIVPPYTFIATGFAAGEAVDVIDTQPICKVITGSYPPGTYNNVIQCSGGVDNNYDFTYLPGNLTVVLQTANYSSLAAQDGWVLESGEITNLGGSNDSKNQYIYVGDDKFKKQYVGILSFQTFPMPNSRFVIKGVTLKIKYSGMTTTSFATPASMITGFQGFIFDVKKGFFGKGATLANNDFESKGNKSFPLKASFAKNLYTVNLTTAKSYINTLATQAGVTQIRVRFKLDDNDNLLDDYLKLYSGNAKIATNRPKLIITYYVLP